MVRALAGKASRRSLEPFLSGPWTPDRRSSANPSGDLDLTHNRWRLGRIRAARNGRQNRGIGAGDGIRTRDILLGKS
jgi:hypothetical protein